MSPQSLDLFTPNDILKIGFVYVTASNPDRFITGDNRRVYVSFFTEGVIPVTPPIITFGGTGRNAGCLPYTVNTLMTLTWWNDFNLACSEIFIEGLPVGTPINVLSLVLTRAAMRRRQNAIRTISTLDKEIKNSRKRIQWDDYTIDTGGITGK